MNFPTREVIATSFAIHQQNGGFFRKHDSEVIAKEKQSNSQLLYKHFFEEKVVEPTVDDYNNAHEIIDYLKGLGFKALERSLTDFESNVLGFVTAESVGKDKLGIAASLPQVYTNKVESDSWADRERELGRTSTFVGELNKRCEFNAVVEFVKFIPKTSSYLVTASVDNKDILKFFVQNKATSAGDLVPNLGITITGYVKSHNVSTYTGFNETMLNRVKVS